MTDPLDKLQASIDAKQRKQDIRNNIAIAVFFVLLTALCFFGWGALKSMVDFAREFAN